jgi:HD-GYP domain-containing protein (c-di-GMP phosphodiesterase class II)
LLVNSGYLWIVPDRLAEQLRVMLRAGQAQVHARDPSDPDGVIVVAASGCDPDVVGSRLAADGGVVTHALHSGQPVVAPDRSANNEPIMAAAPVARDGRVAGVVAVGARASGAAFGMDELSLLCEVAELAGGALERPARREAVEATADAQVNSLATAVELWDSATGPHAADVADVARRCGQLLGLSPSEQLALELAARLHDVGKIRVPRELLRRPGPLADDEYGLVQLHPIWGAELVARVPGMAVVALMIRHHHERVDGCGYPAGLRGDQIPIGTRIVTVADAYATMVEGRPYRTAMTPAGAVEELRAHAGTQFDRDVVDALAESVGVRGIVVPLPASARA